jgi:hypothetical protein
LKEHFQSQPKFLKIRWQRAQERNMHEINAIANQLTEGLRELPTDSVARVKHFIAEYLGNAQHPVPFGGRAGDFEHLDSWLTDTQAPPYALLAAPAGRGKSALLLRWCQRLLTRSDLAVVYFPVSIRFRTNLAGVVFPALVALLARIHGEKVPSDPNMSEEVWRSLFVEYLTRSLPDGRLLLLVLDGVDEAADWAAGPNLFQTDPPPGLRVVLSARYLANDADASSWLQRLGWMREGLAHTLELYPLDRAGIASVLVQMGFPLYLLGTRIDIVSELHRLSEGDPLLIRLYVDDLWERGEAAMRLQPSDLHSIRPGLVGYFERWWNDQRSLWNQEQPEREAALQTVLNLLAGALGPLSQEDILNLIPNEVGLQSGTIEQHLQPLGRFVIGDGLRQGYVFSHPRLANYFLEERLSAEERQEVERRFLDWGEQTLKALNEGNLAPERASAYIVQYYGAHLERAQAPPQALLALVSDGWRRAWEKLDRANAGFLGDSERAWRAAEHEDATATSTGQPTPYLGAQIRSLLCRVSINSMTSNISPRLMLEAVKTGVWTPAQGLACIRLIADLASRAHELVELAPSVQEPLRTDILQEALDTVATIKDKHSRLDALIALAPGLSESLLAQVLDIVPTIDDEADQAGLLVELAHTLAPYQALVEKALHIAQKLTEEEYLSMALEGLALCLFAEQQSSVLQLTLSIQDEKYRAQALTALIPHLPPPMLQEILEEARLMRDGLSRTHLLTELVTALPDPLKTEVKQEILELMHDIYDPEYRTQVLVKLAPCLAEDELGQALQEIQEIWDESCRGRALNSLLPYLSQEQLSTFLQIVRAMRSQEYRSVVLLQLLPRLSASLLEQALDIVQATWDEGYRVEILARMAPFISEELLPKLLALIKTVKDLGYRVWLLAELETSLARKLSVSSLHIVETFRAMQDEEERLQTLLAVIPRISDKALANIFDYILPEIFSFRWNFQSRDRRADILTKLSPRLPSAWLPRVLDMVQVLGSEVYQVQVLAAMAPRMSEIPLPTVLDIVHTIQEREKRAQVLEILITSLPQEHRGKRVREMLQVLQVIKDEDERTRLSTALAAYLPDVFPTNKLPLVFAAVQAMHTDANRLSVLHTLASSLCESMFEDTLAVLRTLHHEEERAHGLEALASYVPEQHVPLFLATVQITLSERWQTRVLVRLLAYTPETTCLGVLKLVRKMPDESARVTALTTLIPYIPEKFFAQLWEAIQEIKDNNRRVWVLRSPVLSMPDEFFPQLWTAIQDIDDEKGQMLVLRALASHLSPDLFSRLWTAIQKSRNKAWRMQALSTLAPYVPESYLPLLWESALTMTDATVQLKIVLEVVARAPKSYFPQVWETANTITDEENRIKLLKRLVAYVPENYFPQVWEVISTMPDEWPQKQLLEALVPYVPESFFPQVWKMVFKRQEKWHEQKALQTLASRVPESYFSQAWTDASTITDPAECISIQQALILHLPLEKLEDVLQIAQASPNPALYEIISRKTDLSTEQCSAILKSLLPFQNLAKSLEAMRSILCAQKWVYVLSRLVPRLPQAELLIILPVLFKALQTMHGNEDQVELLSALAANIPESLLPEMLETIWSFRIEQFQNQVLAALVPSLSLSECELVLEMAVIKMRETGKTSTLLHILHAIDPSAQSYPPDILYPALHEVLHLLAQRTRREALVDLALLAPTIRALGGETAVTEAYCSTLEIGSWWP